MVLVWEKLWFFLMQNELEGWIGLIQLPWFGFDSGGQSFLQRDSSSPPPWRLSPESFFCGPWSKPPRHG